jgi:hypothetical protein
VAKKSDVSTTTIRLTCACGRAGAEGPEGAVLDVESELAALLVQYGSATLADAPDASADPGKVTDV